MKLFKYSMFFFVSACKNTWTFAIAYYTQSMIHLLGNGINVTLQGGRKADQNDVNEKYLIAKK